MEAARVLALRQFHVVLFEKEAKLGGTLNVAADKPAFKDKLTRLSETMETRIRHLGVEVRLDTAATPELVSTLNPVGIVVACGAEPVIPPLPGMQQNHVCTAEDVLTGKANPTGQVAVIGSGLTDLETSEMLLSRGLSVSIVEMASEDGPRASSAQSGTMSSAVSCPTTRASTPATSSFPSKKRP
ncbi:MAG: FAD-dependent oxidoreductase [Eubacteriales bacterium]